MTVHFRAFSSATEVYAHYHGHSLEGPDRCHWCGGPCRRLLPHDDPPPMPGQKWLTTARCRGNCYICLGCWLWRRQRITVFFPDKTFKDAQTPAKWSWWIEPTQAFAVRLPQDGPTLLQRLLKPPRVFALNLLRATTKTELHLMPLNCNESLRADTELRFAIDNLPLKYSVYELEHALAEGPEGTEPGVRALCEMLGVDKPALDLLSGKEEKKEEEKRGPGRPPALVNTARKVIQPPPSAKNTR